MKKQAGFTLAEVLVVIAIMGLLMAIGIPQLLEMIPNMRLKSATRELYAQMQNTRMNAIKNNTAWAILFLPATNQYLVCSNMGPDGDWTTPGDNTVAATINLNDYGSGVQYGHGTLGGNNSAEGAAFPASNVSYSNNVLIFTPQGSANQGYVYLHNLRQDSLYAAGTLSSGSIRILNWAGGAWR